MTDSRQTARGQAIVELVIALGVLLTLTLGLVGVGQILLANYTVSQAARAAAHQAAIDGGEPAAALVAARNVIDGGVGTQSEAAEVEVRCTAPCRRYAPVTVSVVYRGELWAPMPPLLTEFTVRASATRAAERDTQP